MHVFFIAKIRVQIMQIVARFELIFIPWKRLYHKSHRLYSDIFPGAKTVLGNSPYWGEAARCFKLYKGVRCSNRERRKLGTKTCCMYTPCKSRSIDFDMCILCIIYVLAMTALQNNKDVH